MEFTGIIIIFLVAVGLAIPLGKYIVGAQPDLVLLCDVNFDVSRLAATESGPQ